MRHILALMGFLVLVSLRADAAGAQMPVETFFRHPEFTQLSLSPNGRYFGALVPVRGQMNVCVVDATMSSASRATTATSRS